MRNWKTILGIWVFWGVCLPMQGQSCQFSVYYEGKPYTMNTLKYSKDDTLMVLQFKFYVRFLDPQKKQWEHHLLDFYLSKDPITLSLPKKLDAVQLFIGVDSSWQEKGVGEGDLDPQMNMYWGWFPGYIGVKMEGVSTLNGGFQYHLGGFRKNNSNESFIWVKPRKHYAIDLGEFLSKIPAEKSGKIMSPASDVPSLVQEFTRCIHALD